MSSGRDVGDRVIEVEDRDVAATSGRTLAIVWALCVGMAVSGARAHGQTVTPEAASQQAFELAGQIMSPYCPGRTLAACPSSAAADLRADVAERIAKGEPRDLIVESLVARFGEGVRGAPRPVGFGVVLWTLPPLIGGLLLGAVLVVGWRTRAATGEVVVGQPASVLAALHRRLDDELDDMD